MQPLLPPGVLFNRPHLYHLDAHAVHYKLLHNDPSVLTGLSANETTAPVGVNPQCGIPNVKANGSLGNIANIIACGISVFIVLSLIVLAGRRKAAVGEFPPARSGTFF